MSVTFSTGFHVIKPGLRVSGDEISAVSKGVYDSGLYSGQKFIHIDLTNEDDLTFVEAGIAGPVDTVDDVDALYEQLRDAGMTEVFDGFLLDPSDMSVISVEGELIVFDFAGHEPYKFGRNPDAAATEKVKLAFQTWQLPQADFAAAAALFTALESPEELELVSIENRLGLLEATNGLIKQDYSYITLVGNPSPDPGQVGIDAATPSQVSMIVLPKVDADGKTLTFGQFIDGDRMALKQSNGSAALYSLDPVLDIGDHIRFNATLLALGYYADQDFVFNTGVIAVIEDNSTRTSAAGVMGVSESAADLGTFSGSTIVDGSSIKTALQALETAAETTVDSLATEAQARADGDAATLSSANTYTDGKITDLVGNAPAILDTLGEISSAINDDANLYTTLVSQINAVQQDVDQNEADSDSTDDILQANINSEATARSDADSALDTRISALEADPTTQTLLDAEQTAREGADTALSNRIDTLEADPVTKAYVDTADATKLDASAVSAYGATLIDDADAAAARTTLGLGDAAVTAASDYATAAQGALADTAVQPAAISNVDNTSDADKPVSTAQQAALDLKANKAGDTFTGDVIIDEGTGSTIKLETSDATSAGIHIEGPTGSMGYIDTTNGFGNDSLQVYSANFWVRAINNGTGNVIIDGQVTAPGLINAANDGDAATAGVPLNGLYHHNGDMKIRLT